MIYHRVFSEKKSFSEKNKINRAAASYSSLMLISLALVIMAVWAGPVQAAGAINMKAEAGLGGYARNGQYIPVQIMIENQGKTVSGRLELKAMGGDAMVVYQRKVSLANGARKRINMYLPRGNNNPYSIELISGEQKLASARLRLTMLPPAEVSAGILAADPSALKSLESAKFPSPGQHLTTITLKPEEIPEQSLCLNSLDIMVLDNFSSRSLTDKQFNSIEKWTRNGGLLVLVGGPGWQKTFSAIPSALLPVRINGSAQVQGLSGLQDLAGSSPGGAMVISKARVIRGETLAASNGIPLIVQRTVGLGDVLYLAFDIGQKSFEKWEGSTALWSQLLNRTDPHQVISAGANQDENFSYNNVPGILRNFPGVGMPNTKTLAVVLVLYVLVLGPGIYLLLKKMDRRDLGWIAIPLLALVLFSLTYAAAFKGKDRDVFVNVVSLLSLQQDGQSGYLSSYIGVFAPTHTNFDLKMPGDQVLSVGSNGENGMVRHYGPYGPIPSTRENVIMARVEQSDQPLVSFGESSRWSLRSLQTERIVDKSGRIEARLLCNEGKITGTLTNNTPYYLTGSVIFNQYCRQRIGNLRPGQSTSIDIPPNAIYRGSGMIGRVSETYPVNWPRGMHYRSDRAANLTNNMLELAFNSKQLVQAPLTFIGYTSEAPRERIIESQSNSTFYSTIILAPLDVATVKQGQAEILPGLIQGYVSGFTGRNIYINIWGTQVDAGMITYQMDLPFPAEGLDIESFRLLVETGDFAQAQNMKIKVLNHASGEWENLRYNPQGIELPQAKKYINRDGAIKVQVGTDTNIQVNGVSLKMKGKYLSGQGAGNGGGI